MSTWQLCLDRLEGELTIQQFNTWIRPLQVVEDDSFLRLLAPNQFVLDWVKDRLLERINEVLHEVDGKDGQRTVKLEVGAALTNNQTSKPEISSKPICVIRFP